jgi:hypothetical protein
LTTPNTSARESIEGQFLNMDGAMRALLARTLGVSEEESWTSLISAGVLTVRDLDNVAGKALAAAGVKEEICTTITAYQQAKQRPREGASDEATATPPLFHAVVRHLHFATSATSDFSAQGLRLPPLPAELSTPFHHTR